MHYHNLFLTILSLAVVSTITNTATTSIAATVLPMIGGGQAAMSDGAPMKHIGVSFDGSAVHAHVDSAVPTPLLRNLTEPDMFDPSERWAVLIDKHHNFQYGWVPDGIWSPPTGTAVWIERLHASQDLEVYEGGRFMSESTIRSMTLDPIFETDGSPSVWKWNGVMTHNAYAVVNPMQADYSASYRVYIGDEITGSEIVDADGLPRFASDEVQLAFAFQAIPEPATNALLIASLLCWPAIRRSLAVPPSVRLQ